MIYAISEAVLLIVVILAVGRWATSSTSEKKQAKKSVR
jgi:hypothetical protein